MGGRERGGGSNKKQIERLLGFSIVIKFSTADVFPSACTQSGPLPMSLPWYTSDWLGLEVSQEVDWLEILVVIGPGISVWY